MRCQRMILRSICQIKLNKNSSGYVSVTDYVVSAVNVVPVHYIPLQLLNFSSKESIIVASNMSAKPTLILVPGSWHVPEHFEPMTKLLESHGYNAVGARLVSNRQTPPYGQTLSEDAAAVSSRILTECDAGNDIVVVMHSYGGVVGSSAVKGLTKKDREAQGLKGGVVGLIYIAAFVFEEGTKMWDLLEPFADKVTGVPWCPVVDVCEPLFSQSILTS
jgi:pimeloyl-ACP methyl ester carboxylesterase